MPLTHAQHAAETERRQNAEDQRKSEGAVVLYGSMIQLLHVKSHKFVTVNKRLPALIDKAANRVTLSSNGNEGSWFYVLPHYKLRCVGDQVVLGDRVQLSAVGAGQPLHVSPNAELPDCAPSRACEVNAYQSQHLVDRTPWRISLFLNYAEAGVDALKSGEVVRFFHAEQEKFLTCDEYAREANVFLRATGRAVATAATSSKALWEIEVVTDDPCRGAVARWSSLFRVKHLGSGLYMSVKATSAAEMAVAVQTTSSSQVIDSINRMSRSDSLCVAESVPSYYAAPVASSANLATLLELDATVGLMPATSAIDARIPRNSHVRLHSFLTGTWLYSTSAQYFDSKEPKPVMLRIGASGVKDDKEAFQIMSVSSDEVRDLDFAKDAGKWLGNVYRKTERGLSNDDRKYVTLNL